MSNEKTKENEPRMKVLYRTAVVPEMMKRQSWGNALQVPRIKKVVVNIGLSEARENAKVVDLAAQEIAAFTGQKAQVRRSKKAISNFKLREGMPIGVRVTLRSRRMWEFMDRLVSIAIPRIRDFRGLDPHRGFDGQGNYNLGLTEQYVFPEIDLDKSDKPRGMNVTVVTTAGKDDAGLELLALLGMPFKRDKKSALN
ncbi:MAG: 50S ribosomal protein L5 [Elusimicrobia bacterium]|jgi:large subunit ribosomal protein L5|nr:50S ribosomal protein L5 [Elusimicrobiota bacterium]